jgi:hypothetical protein
MRRHLALLPALVLLLACAPSATAQRAAMNTLSDAERREGWLLLFDGATTAGWRGFGQDPTIRAWTVEDGALTCTGTSQDLVTDGMYGDFELRLQWRIPKGGNSGIMYRVIDGPSATYESGPEMQVLDDANNHEGQNPLTRAGANYGLHGAPAGVVRPAGEWNDVRLVLRGPHVEHWLNGTKVVEYELWSPDWEAKVQGSKFAQWPPFGRATRGRIALQEHGARVQYRDIKLRELK